MLRTRAAVLTACGRPPLAPAPRGHAGHQRGEGRPGEAARTAGARASAGDELGHRGVAEEGGEATVGPAAAVTAPSTARDTTSQVKGGAAA